MSRMSDLDSMVRSEGARTAEDFIRLGVPAQEAVDMEEVVRTSLPAPLVSVDAAKLIFAIRQRATSEVVIVTDTPDLPDFYWEDER